MNIAIQRNDKGIITSIVVTREEGDPRFSGSVNAAGESRLLHHVKGKLNALGFDLIKKRMWKDGHLVDDMQQYLRTRKPQQDNPDRNLSLYNDHWAISGLDDDFTKHGKARLRAAPHLAPQPA